MKIAITIIWTLLSLNAFSQGKGISIDKALELALQHNSNVIAASSDVDRQKQLRKASFDLPKTDVSLQYGQYNSYAKNDNNFSVSQTIPFTAFGSQRSVNDALITSYQMKRAVVEAALIYDVKRVYYELAYAGARNELLLQQDSIFRGFLKSAALKYRTGETNLLEKTTAETRQNEVKIELEKNRTRVTVLKLQLTTMINAPAPPEVSPGELLEIEFRGMPDSMTISLSPSLTVAHQDVEIARRLKKLAVANSAPDLRVGVFSQTLIAVEDPESGNIATSRDRFTGVHVGLAIPLWFGPHQAKMKAAVFATRSAQSRYDDHNQNLRSEVNQAFETYKQNRMTLNYYQNSALPNAELILKQSQIAYREGEIGYAEYLLGVGSAMAIKESYLETLRNYNQSIIYIEFLTGNK